MTQSDRVYQFSCLLVSWVLVATSGTSTLAQSNIVSDETLGSENSQVIPNFRGRPVEQIEGGARRGANLFHSFREFNIDEGRFVYFANPNGVQNILSRVTGTNPSNILGTLGVLGNANLFLINPNGIIFGQNASLDIQGSFVATTANAVQFGNRGFFSASDPNSPPLLTVKPSAFLFNQIASERGSIENNSTEPAGTDPGQFELFGLRVPDGKSLLLLGGDINVNSAGLFAVGGRIELGGISGEGTVKLNAEGNNLSLSFPDNVARADVSLLDGALIGVVGEGGGDIAIAARNVKLTEGSTLGAGIISGLGSVKSQAGNIEINATEAIDFNNSSLLNSINSNAIGQGGNINITTGSLSVSNGAQLQSLTRGQGDAGSININARDTVSFDGSIAASNFEEGARGKGGNINITTGSLFVSNGAQLQSLTSGQGDAGSININARNLVSFDGRGSLVASIVEEGARGKAGRIKITTGSLSVTNDSGDSGVLTSTFGNGDAGTININARNRVSFDGGGAVSNVEEGARGKGGTIAIATGSLSMTNGAVLRTSTFGEGDAGTIDINTRDRVSFDRSGALSNVEEGARGKGGTIAIATGSLSMTNSARVSTSTFGNGDAGSINIDARDTVSFDGSGSAAVSNVEEGARGKGGNIAIATRSLSVSNGAQLQSVTRGQGNAGSISINARDRVAFDRSGAFSNVEAGAIGKGGNVNITTGSLSVTNSAQLQSATRGQGSAGTININARDRVSFDGSGSGAFSNVVAGARGNAGRINITTESLSVTNDSRVLTSTSGNGDAGTININARDRVSFDGSGSGAFSNVAGGARGKGGTIAIATRAFSMTNGAFMSTSTVGEGDAGNITIEARDRVFFDEGAAFSTVEEGAIGKGGTIAIATGALSMTNGSVVSSSTVGEGDAGTININARDTVFFARSAAFSTVEGGAIGKGGNVNITTGSLSVTNSAQLQSATRGRGNAGSINIKARDRVSFDESGADSIVGEGAIGKGGTIAIATGALSMNNGAVVSSSTFGRGDAGNININARDTVSFDESGADSIVGEGAIGKGGTIAIATGALSMNNGAVVSSSTFGRGDAGRINIKARDRVSFDGSGVFSSVGEGAIGKGGTIAIATGALFMTNGAVGTSTSGEGNAGSITIKARDRVFLDGGSVADDITETVAEGGLFASTNSSSTSTGGNIFLDSKTVTIQDGARVAVDSQGTGRGGEIGIDLDSLILDRGIISAETASNDGGNIDLNVRDSLFLRNSSSISTTAGTAGADGKGGNIDVNAKFIVAVPIENSDISANAFEGDGGQVNITARGIFGTQFREEPTPLSDITASSEFGSAGVVEIDAPDLNPSRALVNLPTQPVTTEIVQACTPSPNRAQSEFVITGRGGLPPTPSEVLSNEEIAADWVSIDDSKSQEWERGSDSLLNPTEEDKLQERERIIEAQGWIVGSDGKVILTAQTPTVTHQIPWQQDSFCKN
jgi:filamentous hemagglutinin family protein